jgi:hypothetical protein
MTQAKGQMSNQCQNFNAEKETALLSSVMHTYGVPPIRSRVALTHFLCYFGIDSEKVLTISE